MVEHSLGKETTERKEGRLVTGKTLKVYLSEEREEGRGGERKGREKPVPLR